MGYWAGKKALVTGGAGFIGSHLVEYLVEDGADVTIVDNLERGRLSNLATVEGQYRFIQGDLRDPTVCEVAASGMDIVLHVAAKVAGIEYNCSHQADMFTQNNLILSNMIDAAYRVGVPRYLLTSTACVYPNDALVPTPETEGDRGEPEPTNLGYGWAKRMAEKQAQWFAEETDMEVVICRPFNAYGPRDHYDDKTSHVVPALLKRVLEGENPIEVWGSGNQTRVFVHGRDFAKSIQLCAERATDAYPINVGHDEEVTIRELLERILKLTGNEDREVFYNLDKPEGYPRRSADATRLRQVTGGFVPATSLDDGLREMIDLYGAENKDY